MGEFNVPLVDASVEVSSWIDGFLATHIQRTAGGHPAFKAPTQELKAAIPKIVERCIGWTKVDRTLEQKISKYCGDLQTALRLASV